MTTIERSAVDTGLPPAEPHELGFSAERLARIGPVMQAFIDAGEIPGCVTLIARHGKVAHLEARGTMHVDRDAPLRTDTIFRIASATKPIATVALLMLYDEGRFLLDEPISRFLPAFKQMEVRVADASGQTRLVPAAREISIRDCLTHNVGFAREQMPPLETRDWASTARAIAAPRQEQPVAVTLARLAEQPLTFQPGETWEYNAGITVAGHLVELISGMDLDEFLRVGLFAPLGMPDSSFYLPAEKLVRFPSAYVLVPTGDAWSMELADRPETSLKVTGPRVRFDGSGGLLSTAADYARFAQMLLNGGELDGARILGRKTVQLMTTNHTGEQLVTIMGPGYGFGLGVFVRTNLSGIPLAGSVGAYGWGGAWGISYVGDPTEDMFTLFFTQSLGYWGRRKLPGRQWLRWIHQFEALAYQALT